MVSSDWRYYRIPVCGHSEYWCMDGDFNMIEALGDRVGGSNVVLVGSELVSWKRSCFLWRIHDA